MISKKVLSALSGPCKLDRRAALNQLEGLVPDDFLKLLVNIEEVQTTLGDYRNKERYLENLSRLVLNQSEEISMCVLHHLLGTLYINFEKFWGPTIRVIVDLLSATKHQTKLLGIVQDEFRVANDYIYTDSTRELPDDRPDYVLHRNFILQILAKFTCYVESHSVPFMDQLFRFIKAELMVSPFVECFTRENLTTNDKPDMERGKRRPVTGANKSKETLITAARIIQSFKNMTRIHLQGEFREFILVLMASRDGSVQKAAFNCLTAYDNDYIKPYAGRILKLLDDSKIRCELSSFSIDSDSGLINSEHRKQLIPIIHRILFGRMVGQVGKKTSGRDNADKRKSTVMRYIAGCTDDEIIAFFEISFDPIFKFASAPHEKLRATIREDLNIESYVPLNKLQAMISTLNSYLEHVANLKLETLPHLHKMINIVALHVLIPLEDSRMFNRLELRSTKMLKNLKRSCLEISTNYFKTFPHYKFSQAEVDFVFENFVWPNTEGFIDKNHATVTPVLRLIGSFMENKVYHKLIIKRNRLNQDEFLLHHLMLLYDSEKIERPVSKFIAQMICHILKLESDHDDNMQLDEVPEEDYHLQDIDAVLPPYDRQLYKDDKGDMSLGFQMLMHFIPVIFNRLKKNLEHFLAKKDSSYRIESFELLILTALSGYLIDSSHCSLAAKLLLSTLQHEKSCDMIISTLKAVQSLMAHVNELDDSLIIDFIANVLSYQRNGEQRRELCNLVDIITKIDTRLESAGKAVILMNAADDDLMEVPNLEKWNEGFNQTFTFIDSLNEESMNRPSDVQGSLTLLIHQVGFIVATIDKYEFSIRDNCMIFYEKLAAKFKLIDPNRTSKMLKDLLSDVILEKFLKKGIRESKEMIRQTYLGILRTLSMSCEEQHVVFKDCKMFCSSNQDLDFWLNIRHIQLHNRSKALARLISDDNLHKVSRKTLSQYFLPIASGFLFNKNYKSVAALTDNSIKLIGIICKHLEWHTYELTLSYYLDLMTKSSTAYQRTNVKLITEILKNFNFDLTTCEEAMQYEEENKQLEKRMFRRYGQIKQLEESETTESEKAKKLNPSTARMIYHSVTKKLIPRLNDCLNEMTRVDFEYDKNMADYKPEKDELKRIPMAYAIVQLLNLLPGKYVLFRDQLPPIILKLTTFLRSRNEATRKTARATLLKIMSFVGPIYLPDMLRILKQQLDKGFYIHVLNYTIHSVLDGLTLNYGDLDVSIDELVGLCRQEIFGRPSEDKGIAQILAKTSEAKKTKSYDTLLIMASFVSAEKLDTLIGPFKDLLKTSTEPKTVNKLSVSLQRIFTGLSHNKDFPLVELIKFIQDSIEESIPSLKIRAQIESTDDVANPGSLREDRFLIGKDKTKNRVKSKINEKGNLHMVVENSLRLLLLVFEKNKIAIKRKETLQKKLSGLISLLSTCLKSSSPRCVMRALKCLYFIAQTKIDLPEFEAKCESIVKKIFILLSLYNGVGMVQGDNNEMIAMCFKTLTLLLLKCEHVKLNNKQIRALMSYIEQDLNDVSRQSTAFKALESLLQRKCESPELKDIMKKVGELLIKSDDDNVRSLSVKIWSTYLLDYPHEPTILQSHLGAFLRQLDYEYIDGRKSVLKMLRVIVEKFPERILRNNLDLNFPLLAERVVNDDSKEVRLLVGRLIAILLQRLPDVQEYVLNKFVMPWVNVEKSSIRILGIKLLSILMEANPKMFERNPQRLSKILAIIFDSILQSEKDDKLDKDLRLVTDADKLTYYSLRLFERLVDGKLLESADIQNIWQKIASSNLTHWHEPIVLTSCRLFLSLLSGNDNLERKLIRTLCDKFIDLLDRFDSANIIYSYLTQALILLGQMIAKSKTTLEFEQKYVESFENQDVICHILNLDELPNDGFVKDHLPYDFSEIRKKCNLMWISVKMLMQGRKEAAVFRTDNGHRRDLVIRWSAAMAQELGPARIRPYVFLLLMTPVRELTDKSTIQSLIPISEDLMKFIKSLMGVEQFNKIYSRVQLHYTRKRVERKRDAAVLKVRDQASGSKRKIVDNKKKQSAKKRKIAARKVIV